MNKVEALKKQLAVEQARVTKAAKALQAAEWSVLFLEGEIRHAESDTPLRIGHDGTMVPVRCPTCGEDVSTERLFSQHFVIPDWRYPSIGNCPKRPQNPVSKEQFRYPI